jgi:hypothetical protein
MSFDVTEEQAEYIKAQRTNIPEEFTPEEVGEVYYSQCRDEVSALWSPVIQHTDKDQIFRIASIGCGIAGPDVYLCQTLKGRVDYYHAYDNDGTTRQAGCSKEWLDSFYNNGDLTREFIGNNCSHDLADVSVEYRNLPDHQVVSDRYNVIISLLSMGFHYPVMQYESFIQRLLEKDGLLIADIRKPSVAIPDCLEEVTQLSKYRKVFKKL